MGGASLPHHFSVVNWETWGSLPLRSRAATLFVHATAEVLSWVHRSAVMHAYLAIGCGGRAIWVSLGELPPADTRPGLRTDTLEHAHDDLTLRGMTGSAKGRGRFAALGSQYCSR